jgi:RNA polymerase primary sigma factor
MSHASLTFMMKQAGSRTLLTAAEERRLGTLVHAGADARHRIDDGTTENEHIDHEAAVAGIEARDELVVRNVRLVQNVARRYRLRAGTDSEDLFMYGVLGLFRAAELFDPERGVRFSTYATVWVRQAINAALSDLANAVHVPYPQQLNEVRLRTLVAEQGHTVTEAAAVVGLMPATARQLLRACAGAVSLHAPTNGENTTIAERVIGETEVGYEGVEDAVAGISQLGVLAEVFAHLDAQEKAVMRFFLEVRPEETATLDRAAEVTGLPTTLVRSKRLSARSKLAHPAANLRQQLVG